MKKFYTLFILMITINALTTVNATAQASVVGHICAEVVEALQASEVSPLNFGRFSPQVNSGGYIQVSPQGDRSVIGTVDLSTGTQNAGGFQLTGAENAQFSISLPTEPVLITNNNTAKSMLVTNWVSSPGQGTGVGVLTNGMATVFIGATLVVGSMNENPTGTYSGTYTVTFDYN